ncbi:phosphotransferase family protein [Actinoplanes xinjiangensis]|uniref:Phosphotransferase family enzyme n=1 Tax=Actinoplanes xinjiangensis TaxID=512350 RepID=A0A316FM26_9ACTN|nr:phosphotransferase [Actinoplanes xinjiangensis]PWK48766.1 phosphotransferase family enzyme [Actinoplanes xinjiangensis]
MDLLGSGREADVYAIDERRVLRRYRRGDDVTAEAEIMTYLAGHGYPVPQVHAASGADMILERLDGPTMTDAFTAGKLGVDDGAAILVDLHERLHRLPAPSAGLAVPARSAGLAVPARSAGLAGPAGPAGLAAPAGLAGLAVPAGLAGVAVSARSAGLPGVTSGDPGARRPPSQRNGASSDRILHRDLHPDNVMLTSRGPVVIDWHNAAQGRPAVDVCLTAVIMAQVAASPAHPHAVAAAAFLTAFLNRTGGEPLDGLDEALEIRRADPALTATEAAGLAAVVTPLIRGALRPR